MRILKTPAVVVKRSAYVKIGLYRLDLPHTADWDLWIRLTLSCNVCYLDQILCNYRIFEGSRTNLQRKQGKAAYGITKIHYIISHVYKLNSLRRRFLISTELSACSFIYLAGLLCKLPDFEKFKYAFSSLFLAALISPFYCRPILPFIYLFSAISALVKKIF